jgi:2-polyprenyl-6-methoxyphenol hydroxylase-like FAD-dependent oxidoreductase
LQRERIRKRLLEEKQQHEQECAAAAAAAATTPRAAILGIDGAGTPVVRKHSSAPQGEEAQPPQQQQQLKKEADNDHDDAADDAKHSKNNDSSISSSSSSSSSVVVAIIGGGIGGFGAALALQLVNEEVHRRRANARAMGAAHNDAMLPPTSSTSTQCSRTTTTAGIEFRVFERDACFDARKQGYGLTIQQGSTALRRLRIATQVAAHDTPSDSHYIFHASGRIVGFFGRHFISEGGAAAATPTADAAARSNSEQKQHATTAAALTAKQQKQKEAELQQQRRQAQKRAQQPRQQQHMPRFNLHIPRQMLRRSLFDNLRDKQRVIAWNKRLVSIDKTNEGKATGDGATAAATTTTTTPTKQRFVLHFADKTQCRADVVLGADGIFSRVRRHVRLQQQQQQSQPAAETATATTTAATRQGNPNDDNDDALHYLGVLVILGIVESSAPLVLRRTLQTCDGSTRLFVMPFTAAAATTAKKHQKHTIMWQLSMPLAQSEAVRLAKAGPAALKAHALKCCATWHEPIPELLAATSLELVSGTPVYDRDVPHAFFWRRRRERRRRADDLARRRGTPHESVQRPRCQPSAY